MPAVLGNGSLRYPLGEREIPKTQRPSDDPAVCIAGLSQYAAALRMVTDKLNRYNY